MLYCLVLSRYSCFPQKNVLLNTLLSDTLSLCSSLNMSD